MALKGNQKRLDRNNNNRIDAQDFKILKAEKAKGRGQGLQDEKMKPGKTMKAMGGGMMKRYNQGGGADTGTAGEARSKRGVAINKLTRAARDIPKNIGTQSAIKRLVNKIKGDIRDSSKTKMMGGGMMMRPMGYSKGKSVMAKGCKLGRKKPTKMY